MTWPVFDFGSARMRQLFIEECVNATKTGVVDGCFADRAVDGTPTDSGNDTFPCDSVHSCRYKLGLSDDTARAYFNGHVQVLTDLQAALGDGPLIANHAYGPPHDAMLPGSVSFSMIEGFGPNNASITQLRDNAANGRGVQEHAGRADESSIAAFLVGAGHRAYFGLGGWGTSSQKALDDHWQTPFEWPLGAPVSDGVYDSDGGGVWTRRCEHVNVTFRLRGGTGAIEGWQFSPTPAPTPPPAPTPAPVPTPGCFNVTSNCGYNHGDLTHVASASWSECCALCRNTPHCAKWVYWTETQACRLHDSSAPRQLSTDARVCGQA